MPGVTTALTPPVSAPLIAVSAHAWDPYFTSPGSSETPSPKLLRHLDALAGLNTIQPGTVTFVRVDMGWSASQPKKGVLDAGSYYNRRFQWLFSELTTRSLKPFVVVHQSPAWARPANPGDVKQFPSDAASIFDWAAWLPGAFPAVRRWEMWNEPNLDAFTGKTRNTPEQYMKVASTFAAGARSADPNCQLIGGNVSQSDWKFLDRCYDLGLASICDIIGVHPYQGRQAVPPASTDTTGITKTAAGWEKARITSGLPLIYDTMTRHGDACKPLWATEVGWSASATGVTAAGVGKGGTWPTIEDKAAAYITEFLTMLTTGSDQGGAARAAAYKRVNLATIYELFDPLSADAHQKGFEIITGDGGLKPQAKALTAFRRAYPRVRAA